MENKPCCIKTVLTIAIGIAVGVLVVKGLNATVLKLKKQN
jgi:hypothetical protein